ncbi:MAG: hypothetical protein WC708_13165 [Lentisphaeria bacterium]
MAAAAAPRLAVVAVTPAAEARTVADQLTAALSREPATLALVERQQVDAVLRELGLAAAQGRGGQLALGERLNAQGLLLLDVADRTLTARLVDGASGLVLFSEAWPVDAVQGQGLPEAATARLRERILAGLRQAAALAGGAGVKGATVVAVAPLRNRNGNETDDHRAEALSRLLALMLSKQPGLLLVERDELRRVAEEKNMEGTETGRLVAAAVVVTGSAWFAPAKPETDKMVAVETVLQRGTTTQPGPAMTGDTGNLVELAGRLAGATAACLRSGGTVADSANTAPFDAVGEARYFLWLAKCWGTGSASLPFLETALALDPNNPDVRRAMAQSLRAYGGENCDQPISTRTMRWILNNERALHLCLQEPPVLDGDIGDIGNQLNNLNPNDFSPAQLQEIRQARALLRRYMEAAWDIRDGVPHRHIGWTSNILAVIPALFETPEEAVAYMEPMAVQWLRSPEPLLGQDTLTVLQCISDQLMFYCCPRWDKKKVEPLFAAMMRRLLPLASVSDPLIRAEAAFICAYQGERRFQTEIGEGGARQSEEAVLAAVGLLSAYQARAASNPNWAGEIKNMRQGRAIWLALGCLPGSDQEKWFDNLLLPALQQEYRPTFSYPVAEFFVLPSMPASSPEYRRMFTQAYSVLSRQSGQNSDNALRNMRITAQRLGMALTTDRSTTGAWPAREIDLTVAGLVNGSPYAIHGYIQEAGTIWFLFHGAWTGVVRYDVREARVTGAVKLPWPRGNRAGVAVGSQPMAVTPDAVWCLMYGQLWCLPKTAFTLPATTETIQPLPNLTPAAAALVLVDDWIYWITESRAIWRMRQVAGRPVGTAESVADAARVGGPGPLDGGLPWGAIALVADPPRHRVVWGVNEASPNPPWDEGPRNGIWSHQVATGHFEHLIAARFPDVAKVSTIDGDRWMYSGDCFVRVALDLGHDRVTYGMALDPPFTWKHPGDQQATTTPNLPLAVPGPGCFDGWTKPCFTVTLAAPDAFLLFTPRGDGVRVRVFTPTTCLGEVKNDARLLDHMVGGAWWTPRGILVAAVPERTGPMKLWLYESVARPATTP